MDTTLIATLAGGLAGGAAGGLIAVAAVRSRLLRRPDVDDVVEPELIETWDVDGFATEWARRSGRPAAAGLVAEKIRLAEQLQQRRQRRGWSS